MKIPIALSAILLSGCAATRPITVTTGADQEPGTAYADVRDTTGQLLGRLTLTPVAGGTRVQGSLRGLPPGPHALHVHAVGQCVAPFTSAGPHFNPGAVPHGLDTPRGGHAGDLPNIVAGEDGRAAVAVTGRAVLTGEHGMLDADGAAIVVHAAPDDGRTDPAGNAGARIACGVVTR